MVAASGLCACWARELCKQRMVWMEATINEFQRSEEQQETLPERKASHTGHQPNGHHVLEVGVTRPGTARRSYNRKLYEGAALPDEITQATIVRGLQMNAGRHD